MLLSRVDSCPPAGSSSIRDQTTSARASGFTFGRWRILSGPPRALEKMSTFAELVASRKAWIERELEPWCRQAALKDLRLAAELWLDIAGKVDPEKTLWCWAWSRFPALVNADLQAIDESHAVTVTLKDGRALSGIPDGRQSREGRLVLLCRDRADPRRFVDEGPFTLDEIATVARAT